MSEPKQPSAARASAVTFTAIWLLLLAQFTVVFFVMVAWRRILDGLRPWLPEWIWSTWWYCEPLVGVMFMSLSILWIESRARFGRFRVFDDLVGGSAPSASSSKPRP